jgi:hypothetical protein
MFLFRGHIVTAMGHSLLVSPEVCVVGLALNWCRGEVFRSV